MSPFVLPLTFVALVFITMVVLNERIGLFRGADEFRSPAMKYAAYAWLGLFMLLLGVAITGASLRPPTSKDLEHVSFYSLFSLHAILIVFLFGWWLLTGRPALSRYLSIHRER